MKRWQGLLLGLAVSVAAAFVAIRGVELDQVIDVLGNVRYGYALATVPLVVVSAFLRAAVWSTLLENRMPYMRGFWVYNISTLFNNLLPFRMGEVARASMAARQPDIRFAQALSSVVVERIIDLLSVVVLLVILLQLPQLSLPQWAANATLILGSGVAISIVMLFIAARNPARTLKIARRLLTRVPFVGRHIDQLESFLDGLEALRNLKVFLKALGISWLGWIVAGLASWLLLLAFEDIEQSSIEVGFLAVAAAGLGVALPALPGAVGSLEAVIKITLVAIGISNQNALSYALLLHASNFGTTSLLGVIGLLVEGLKFREIATTARLARNTQSPDFVPDIQVKSVAAQ